MIKKLLYQRQMPVFVSIGVVCVWKIVSFGTSWRQSNVLLSYLCIHICISFRICIVYEKLCLLAHGVDKAAPSCTICFFLLWLPLGSQSGRYSPVFVYLLYFLSFSILPLVFGSQAMGIHQRRNKRTQAFVSFLFRRAFYTVPLLVTELGRLVMIVDLVWQNYRLRKGQAEMMCFWCLRTLLACFKIENKWKFPSLGFLG